MTPILRDLGHITGFEELGLTRNLDGDIRCGEMPGPCNPFENTRAPPLLRDGYAYSMAAQHGYQYDETMLQTLHLRLGDRFPRAPGWPTPGTGHAPRRP
jgi:hypothetical protein